MSVVFSTLVQNVIAEIGEVEGSSVQAYSEPRVEEKIRQAVRFILKKCWWDDYMKWYQVALDGTLGISTTSLVGITALEDVRAIYRDTTNYKLKTIPQDINPFTVTGTKPLYYEMLPHTDTNYTDRRLQFWPKDSQANLVIHARLEPTIAEDTILHLDRDLLTWGAAWLILEDEDLNAAAAAKNKAMFEQKFQDIVHGLGDQGIQNPYGSVRHHDYYTEWR